MKSIETGREVLKYIGETAREVSGIGEFQRFKRGAIVPDPDNNGELLRIISPTITGLIGGFGEFLLPLSQKLGLKEEDPKNLDSAKYLFSSLADMTVDMFVVSLIAYRYPLQAAVLKFGWNTFAQIAPDVAKLAKKRLLLKTK